MRRVGIGALLFGILLFAASTVSAQVSITGTIAGTVTDVTKAAIPGANVKLVDEGTKVEKNTVTNSTGVFTFRDLSLGTYEVTISLTGFRTATYNKVVVETGRTTEIRAELAVGGVEQNVTVEGRSPVLELTSNVIGSTMTHQQVQELPLPGRNAFTFARLVPGAVAPQGTGSTHYNGMPGGTINPTIDGVNNSSNGFKSGGTSFFGTVPARLGAVEQVTVETAGLGGDDGVTGGVNLKFVTRRGSGRYTGSFFDQWRTDKLNANSFGNVARGIAENELNRHEFGGNFGGPVPIGDRNKLFFFVNHEVDYIPQTTTRETTVLTAEANQGIFRYATSTGEQRTINVYQMAAAAGLQSTPDPTIAALLLQQASAREHSTAEPGGSLRQEDLSWREPQKAIDQFPTVRLDYQIKPNVSIMGSYNRRNQDQQGRRVWPIPGFPINADTFDAGWWVVATGMNWTVNNSMHNEMRFGVQHSGDTNEVGRQKEFFERNGFVNGLPARFQLPLVSLLVADNAPVIGKHYITTITDTFTMLKGNHTLTFGGNFRDTQWRDRSLDGAGTGGYLGLPRYALGVATGDPAENVFSTATIPGLVNADQGAVRQLYALLTGRLSEVRTGKVVDPATLQYSDSIFRENWTSAWFAGLFIQDKWRVNPNFTLNLGLRYEMNQPPFNHTGTVAFPDDPNIYGPSTQLFDPGGLGGVANPVISRGFKAADTDWNNWAPRIGFTWSPYFSGGILGKIFGTGENTVIRGGYDLTFFDEGTNMFASTAGNNTGQSQALVLTPGTPGFAPGSLTLQSALPPFAASPVSYQETWNQSELAFVNGIGSMFSGLVTPYVQAWNIGVQRQIANNTVVEVRYLGNRAYNAWHAFSLNEVNIFENGFVDEFKRAQQNLAINVANGSTGFANQGRPGQTSLPMFEAAFGPNGSQGALPGNQSFTSANFISDLQNGEAGRAAGRLATTQMYLCRMVGSQFSPCANRNFTAPGQFPMNVFQVNPFAVNGLTVVDDDGWSNYHAMQLQLRRRYATGVSLNVNYTLGKNLGNIWADSATQGGNYLTLRDRALNDGPAPFDVRHVFQTFGTIDLPWGGGRRYEIENGVLDALAGGWTFGTIFTAQSGTPFRLTSGRQTVNGNDAGVVLANGHTVEEIQKLINIRPHPTQNFSRYWADEALIGPDGRANPEYLTVPTTPGEFGQIIYLRGKNVWSFDFSLNKSTALVGRARLEIHITMQNVLNLPVWGTPGFLGSVLITDQTFGLTTNPVNNGTPRQLYSRFTFRF